MSRSSSAASSRTARGCRSLNPFLVNRPITRGRSLREHDKVLSSWLDPEERRDQDLQAVHADPLHKPVDRQDGKLLLGQLDDESRREVVGSGPVAVRSAAFGGIGAGGLVTMVTVCDQHRSARAKRGHLGHATLVGEGPDLVDRTGRVGGPPAGLPGLRQRLLARRGEPFRRESTQIGDVFNPVLLNSESRSARSLGIVCSCAMTCPRRQGRGLARRGAPSSPAGAHARR